VRQVLDQELYKTLAQRDSEARQARLKTGGLDPHPPPPPPRNNTFTTNPLTLHSCRPEESQNKTTVAVKRDFFGRVIAERPLLPAGTGTTDDDKKRREEAAGGAGGGMVWVTYHEGMNNAVRKPVSLEEFLRGF
jgi:chromosome transmission fidelity protein 18